MVKLPSLGKTSTSSESHRVTTFELFFDLVFVFAFTQVTAFMAHEHSALGVLQGLVILMMLWWSWVAYSWLANQTRVDEGIVRVGMTVAMLAMFGVALTIPEAFHDLEGGLSGPLVLAICYVGVRIVHTVLYLIAAGEDVALRRQVLRSSSAAVVGAALIITGAIIGGEHQVWWWLAGFAADAVLTYATSSGGNWRIQSPAHWAERYGLIVILALGESIVAIGVGAAELPVSVPILAGAGLGMLLAVGLWFLYFDVVAVAAEHALSRKQGIERVLLATDGYTYLHLSIIAGVIISALGVEQVLVHVDSTEPFGWFGACALFGGTALYLAGHGFFWRRAVGSWNTLRFVTATLLVILTAAGAVLPPLAALGLVVVVIAVLASVETVRHGAKRTEIRAARAA